jgi:hypothetical protein
MQLFLTYLSPLVVLLFFLSFTTKFLIEQLQRFVQGHERPEATLNYKTADQDTSTKNKGM